MLYLKKGFFRVKENMTHILVVDNERCLNSSGGKR